MKEFSKYFGRRNGSGRIRGAAIPYVLFILAVSSLIGMAVVFAMQDDFEIEWMQTIDGDMAGSNVEVCYKVLFDQDGNSVYSCGEIGNVPSDPEFVVFKMNADDGAVLWQTGINSSPDAWGVARDVALHSSGDVIGVGYEELDDYDFDVVVTRLDRDNGDIVWLTHVRETYYGVPDLGTSIVIDGNDDVIIGAQSGVVNDSISWHPNFAVIKLDGDTGDVVWELYGEGGVFGGTFDVLVDAENDVYAGGDWVYELAPHEYSSNQKVIKVDGQTGEELWATLIQGTDIDAGNEFHEMVMGDDDLYICGDLYNLNSARDISASKIDKDTGEVIWTSLLDGPAGLSDFTSGIAIDDNEDIYVCGWTKSDAGGYIDDFTVAKFAGSDGSLIWDYYYMSSPGSCKAYDISYDPAGYVVSIGYASPILLEDVYTVKLDASTGDLVWNCVMTGGGPYYYATDWGYSVDIDPAEGEVYIGGMMAYSDTGQDFLVAKISDDLGTGEIIIDDFDPEFFVYQGSQWNTVTHQNAWGGSAHYHSPGTGSNMTAWRVDTRVTAGLYDAYAWKPEHDYMHLMATDAHYLVRDRNGFSDWIYVDQSAPGNEWVYLGNFEFDDSSIQGIGISDEADGFVIADAIKLVYTGPLKMTQ